MKKSCHNCKAYFSSHISKFSCALGYQQESIKEGTFNYQVKPVEDCPKPLTFKKLESLKCHSDIDPLTLMENHKKSCLVCTMKPHNTNCLGCTSQYSDNYDKIQNL